MGPASGPKEPASVSRGLIWDLPTRLVHWSVVLLFAALWWTGEKRMLDWHRLAGYTLLALILFRLLWGMIGSTTARFGHFLRGPATLYRYVCKDMFSRSATPHIGHNPVGGWSVLALLATLLAELLTGLVAVDVDGLESGPFSYLVDFDQGRAAAALHHFLFNLLVGLVALHLLAIVYHLAFHRNDLVRPMLTGRRPARDATARLHFAPLPLAGILLLGCAAMTWVLVRYFGQGG